MKTLSRFMARFIALSLAGATVVALGAEPAAPRQSPAKPAAVHTQDPKSAGARQDGATKAAAPTASARVELDTTQITGNRELPRVLYVVPWKKADLGELSGKPTKSLLDEVLAPVDRDVFRRQMRYHEALQPDTSAPGKADAAGGER